jgi:hypothetical protein
METITQQSIKCAQEKHEECRYRWYEIPERRLAQGGESADAASYRYQFICDCECHKNHE